MASGASGVVRGCGTRVAQDKVAREAQAFKDLEGCWEWPGGRTPDGYGKVYGGGEQFYAHRVSFEEFVRPLEPGEGALHSCDNPPCFRPDHLFPGDQGANLKDAAAKGRIKNQHTGQDRCINGHEYTEENTRVTAKGHRVCRACVRENTRRRRRDATGR